MKASVRLIHRLDNAWTGGVLLLLAAMIGVWTIDLGFFVDESAALGLARLGARGEMLYRDTFHHHFPLSMYLPTLAFQLFEPSLLVARLSLLCLTLGLSAWAMRLTRWYFAVGLAVLTFKIVGVHYFGGLVLYDNTVAPALLLSGSVVLGLLVGRIRPSGEAAAAVVAGGALATLSTPVGVFPALLCVVFPGLRSGLRPFAWRALTGFLAVGAVLLGYLWLRGGLGGFVERALAYNLVVSGPVQEIRPWTQWWWNIGQVDLVKALLGGSRKPFFAIDGPFALDPWLFGGVLFRAAIVIATLHLLVRRRFVAAGFLFFFATSLNLRGSLHWHANSLLLFSFFCVGLASLGVARESESAPPSRVRLARWVDGLGRALLVLGFCWMLIRSTAALGAIDRAKSTTAGMEWATTLSQRILDLAGDGPEPLLLSLPYSDYQHLLTGFRAPGGFIFIDTHVATFLSESYHREIQAAIEDPKTNPIIVVARPNAMALGQRLWTYLGPELRHLTSHLTEVESGLFVSPHLAEGWLAGREGQPEAFYASMRRPEGDFRVWLQDPSLMNNSGYYLRVDVYPEHNPRVFERHDGWWDIELERISSANLRLLLDSGELVVEPEGQEPFRVANGRPEPFRARGPRVAHVTLWRRADEGLPQHVDGFTWDLPSWNVD
jgi:hypothetical protein